MWGRSTKQRRAAQRRRGHNGEYRDRFIERVSVKIEVAERRLSLAFERAYWATP